MSEDRIVKVIIHLGNAEMQNYRDINRALANIVLQIHEDYGAASILGQGLTDHKIIDLNGNSVGYWEVTDKE